MALGDPYATLPEFKDYLDIPDQGDDTRADIALRASARLIELYCRRQFNSAGWQALDSSDL